MGREPTEVDREDDLEDDPQPEDGDHPYDRPVEADHDVREAVPASPRDDPEGDPDDGRDEHAADRELDRSRETSGNLPPHRFSVVELPDRDAQVSSEDARHIPRVLDPWGLVEAELPPGFLDDRRGRLTPVA